jgi:hypothetical protein
MLLLLLLLLLLAAGVLTALLCEHQQEAEVLPRQELQQGSTGSSQLPLCEVRLW